MKAITSQNTLELRLSEAKRASEGWSPAKRESMMAFVSGNNAQPSDSTANSGAGATKSGASKR